MPEVMTKLNQLLDVIRILKQMSALDQREILLNSN